MIVTMPLNSTMLDIVTYDKTEMTMEVSFKNNKKYLYEQVPESVFVNLINAESPGKFYNANIRGKYGSSESAAVGSQEDMPGSIHSNGVVGTSRV